MKIKSGFFVARVKLPLWFLLLAVWTIFSPRTGIKVLEAYASKEEAILKKKLMNYIGENMSNNMKFLANTKAASENAELEAWKRWSKEVEYTKKRIELLKQSSS